LACLFIINNAIGLLDAAGRHGAERRVWRRRIPMHEVIRGVMPFLVISQVVVMGLLMPVPWSW
jgi:hypothetical protein